MRTISPIQTKTKPKFSFPPTQTDLLQRKCASCGQQTIAGGECSECQKKRSLLRHRSINQAESSEVPPIVHEALRSHGQPLDFAARTFMEARFGQDFSRVRVHKDAQAAKSARAVNALAYTRGQNIVFGAGQYQPATTSGQKLLAHELTHVLQQSESGASHQVHLDLGAVDDPAEKEADRVARSIIGGESPEVSYRLIETQLQRQPTIEDPIHEPLIEEYRRQHGFPLGGVDEFGRQVGPTNAEIKYFLLPRWVLLPLCPKVENLDVIGEDFKDPKYRKIFTDINCLSSESQTMPPACRFSRAQETALKAAQKEAATRAQRGLDRIGAGKVGRDFAREMMDRLFNSEPPTLRQVVTRLRAVRDFLQGSAMEFVGRTCGDETCQRGAVAYVHGPRTLPIYICPTAFSRPSHLHRTVLHEALHWSGLDADPATPEGYCEKFDCVTPCLTKEDADAWAHYLDCLGQPLEMHRSFREKILESVHEIP